MKYVLYFFLILLLFGLFVDLFMTYIWDMSSEKNIFRKKEKSIWEGKDGKCTNCYGTGKIFKSKRVYCKSCDGTGKDKIKVFDADKGKNIKIYNLEDGNKQNCYSCSGKGYTFENDYSKDEEDCYACKGKGSFR